MRIATVLFTYKRYKHTKAVLDALSQNTVLPQKLIIFQDGLKDERDKEEWLSVNNLIDEQSFCPVEIVVSNINKGLAKSVVDGVQYAFADNDAIIVLEDDCVPGINFMMYMEKSLCFYETYNEVWGISGYGWPGVKRIGTKFDVYFSGRISSWGWATWNNRWKKYSRDPGIISRMRKDKESSVYLSQWGNDLDVMLRDQIRGINDSWAVYWALNMIEERGLFVMPYDTQIKNIGLDGSGVHCLSDSYNRYNVKLNQNKKDEYSFLEDFSENTDIKEMVKPLFGSYIAGQEFSADKKDIIVYGTGGCFVAHERQLTERYNVRFLFDRAKNGYIAGVKLLNIQELTEYMNTSDLYLLIMMYDQGEISRIKEYLVNECQIDSAKILGYGGEIND